MSSAPTVAFIDLTGSEGVRETLGPARATQTFERLRQWITRGVEVHGYGVQPLGGGVLAVFADPRHAVDAAVRVQRDHQSRILTWPIKLRMRLKVALAIAPDAESPADVQGSAVNQALQLSRASGPDNIWATEAVVAGLAEPPGTVFRRLDAPVGRVVQIDWEEAELSSMLHVPGSPAPRPMVSAGRIELHAAGRRAQFAAADTPIHLGRLPTVDFAVDDPRVSRQHARIEYRGGAFVLCDASSFGTWVRFEGHADSQALHRRECTLTGDGEIAFSSPFEDDTAPTVTFHLLAP